MPKVRTARTPKKPRLGRAERATIRLRQKKPESRKDTRKPGPDTVGAAVNRSIRQIVKVTGKKHSVVENKGVSEKHLEKLERAGYQRHGKGEFVFWVANPTPLPKKQVISNGDLNIARMHAKNHGKGAEIQEASLTSKQRWVLWKAGWHRIDINKAPRGEPLIMWSLPAKTVAKKKKAA